MVDTSREEARRAMPFALFLLYVASGLLGAGGVALAAVAAHAGEYPTLASAATMQMVHAPALLGICAIARQTHCPRPWLVLGFVMLASVALFALALVHHAILGRHVFAYAAPIGGSGMIVSWLTVAVLAGREYLGQMSK